MLRRKWTRTFIWHNLAGAHRLKGIAADRRQGVPGFTGGNKRGQDTKYGFLSPLDSPDLPSRCASLRSRSEMRGAHSDVWCSKGTRLMEAELFAATAFAPCTGWPRTVMRGKSRKVNSGTDSVPKSARRTEPSPRFPRFAARPKGVAAQRRVWGSQEGAREPYGALAPFCPRRRAAVCRFTQSRNSRFSYKTNRLSPSSMVYYS